MSMRISIINKIGKIPLNRMLPISFFLKFYSSYHRIILNDFFIIQSLVLVAKSQFFNIKITSGDRNQLQDLLICLAQLYQQMTKKISTSYLPDLRIIFFQFNSIFCSS